MAPFAQPGRERAARLLRVGAVIAAIAMACTAQPAAAQPQPATASDAVQRLIELSRQTEVVNQQLLGAQDEAGKKAAEQRTAEARLSTDQAAAAAAQRQLTDYQPVIDQVAVASYQGGRTNRVLAVLVSDSPQQLLDQLSTLDVLATRTAEQIARFQLVRNTASAAAEQARRSATAARLAADKASQTRSDLGKRQSELQGGIAQVMAIWAGLSTGQKARLAGPLFPPGFTAESLIKSLPPGSGARVLAAGIPAIGAPYVWGATGPSAFDCSGLVQWIFKQLGISAPRTSQAQASYGTPVDRASIQVGDVVTFYGDASHVGIYAGNGNMLHASTFGVPVAIAPMNYPIHSIRRYH